MSVDDSTKQKVLKFLRHHPSGVLSTVDSHNKPWGATIYYIVDDDFKFYFNTRVETSKYKNIENNPYVSLTVTDQDSQTTVQLAGKVSKLSADKYMDIVFGKLADQVRPKDDSHWRPPLSKLKAGNYMPLQISPSQLQYADFGKKKTDTNADYIEKII